MNDNTNLLKQIVNLKVHLQNSFISAFVMEGNDESSWDRRCDIKVYMWSPNQSVSATERIKTVEGHTYFLGRYFQQ